MNRCSCIVAAALFAMLAIGDLSAAPPRKASGPWNPTVRSSAPATIDPAPLRNREASRLFAKAQPLAASARAVRNDIDGDGRSDLIWHTYERDFHPEIAVYRFAYWRMNGATILSKHSYEIDTNFRDVTTGDYDGDGRADILFVTHDYIPASPEKRVFMWRSRGDSTFDAYFLGSVPKAWVVASPAAVADINGDGRDDIVWENRDKDLAAYWLMNGASVIGSSVFGVNDDCRMKGAGDFDGDGDDDLLCTTPWRVYLLRNTGSGGFDMPGSIPFESYWNISGNVDLNGDGRTDIVWNGSRTVGMMGFWWMNGSNVIHQEPRWIGYDSYFLGVGDYDGDGLGDVVSLQTVEPDRKSHYVLLWRNTGNGFDIQLVDESDSIWLLM